MPSLDVLRAGTAVVDRATYASAATHPTGIEHVFVNSGPAILHGGETGERTGRPLRRA